MNTTRISTAQGICRAAGTYNDFTKDATLPLPGPRELSAVSLKDAMEGRKTYRTNVAVQCYGFIKGRQGHYQWFIEGCHEETKKLD